MKFVRVISDLASLFKAISHTKYINANQYSKPVTVMHLIGDRNTAFRRTFSYIGTSVFIINMWQIWKASVCSCVKKNICPWRSALMWYICVFVIVVIVYNKVVYIHLRLQWNSSMCESVIVHTCKKFFQDSNLMFVVAEVKSNKKTLFLKTKMWTSLIIWYKTVALGIRSSFFKILHSF